MAPALNALVAWLVPFSAGGFVYIAAADLIPQLREEGGQAPSGMPLLAIPLGIADLAAVVASARIDAVGGVARRRNQHEAAIATRAMVEPALIAADRSWTCP